MDAAEQIKRFQEFFESRYYSELIENVRKGDRFLVIGFSDLAKFDPSLAELLLDNPEDVIRAAEMAMEQFDIDAKGVRLRIKGLPASQQIKIRDIRSAQIGKLLCVVGLVRQKSDVRPQVTSARFECPSCGNVLTVLQLDQKFKEPSRCSCGRKGKFRVLDKELVDAQGVVLEEIPEDLEGGEQPKRINVLLKGDLVSPLSDKKTNPGTKIVVNGILKEIPLPARDGGQLTRFELMLEGNYVDALEEEFGEIKITEEDKKKIEEIEKDPRGYQKLVNSIASSIYGHEQIKEALLLQLLGGVRKRGSDGVVRRGDIHILLIGDPGCIAGDSQVALFYKGMEKIQNLGKRHLEPIKEVVTKIRKNSEDSDYDFATTFHFYTKQPVLRVVTETGKELVCTYNHPLLTKKGWKRADEILLGTKIRVMPKIPNNVKKLALTGFVKLKKKSGALKGISLPDRFTPELASLCGYIVGNGNVHKKEHSVTCSVNGEEEDLIEKLSSLWKKTFNIEPKSFTKNIGTKVNTIDDGGGLLRLFVSKQQMTVLEIDSRQIAQSLLFLSNKRVPQQIFRSPKLVVARFISWLFEANGYVFGNGAGKVAIQLKSDSAGLLHDIQLLLLYFGIQSRIKGNNLCIRRSYDVELFARFIGFNSKKKKEALNNVLNEMKNKSNVQKRKLKRWERVVSIAPAGIMDVYDFEVPASHTFIANGIVCHNSGKSQLLKRIAAVAPKARYVSGKGASGAGLTAAVVRDEFLHGWALEAGALVLTNKGICMIDELDKMSKEDRDAMHEALEQQTVSISKANIQATLKCETTVLAAANPKFGRFDPYEAIPKQIDLPPTLINRFDLIFPIKDIPSVERDEEMASFILNLHQDKIGGAEIETPLLRKYLAYARQNIFPVLTEGAIEEIKRYYLKMRSGGITAEGGIKAVPISARQLEALIRLSEASARARLSNKVGKRDAKRAIEIVHFCLKQIGVDPETGGFDIDRITTGISGTQRSKIHLIKDIIIELENKLGKTISVIDIVKEAVARGMSETEIDEIIEKLKRSGDIFEPRHGFIQRI